MSLSKKIGLLLLIPLFSFSTHKYYVSLTQIEYNTDENSLEIITNVNMDDIEFVLNKEYNIDLKLTTKEELKNTNEYFKKYIDEKLKVIVDKKNVKFNFIGKEYEGDLVYFYLEIKNIINPTSIEISNRLLLTYFNAQQNIVKVTIGSKTLSKILNKTNNKTLLNF